ncbi:PH domain-containing protein [Halobacillus litoralis]|uniref:PH domain-containing protein n=1 Tax=Halobacillus litoralis TaxID=45668 RepID=UPI001CD2F974|nr:PH domain-containing protein [Halobacillus litoralis]MCA0972482.1 PH domain-containing protein [Halobacillus litoralis]
MMTFKGEKDRFFAVYVAKSFFLITCFWLLPFFVHEYTHNLIFAGIWSFIYFYLLFTSILIIFNVKYEFEKDHLYAQGGTFKRRIPYESIYRIRTTADVYFGDDILLTSGNAIEIFFYKNGREKSLKVSPDDRETFISILGGSCPQADMDVYDISYN